MHKFDVTLAGDSNLDLLLYGLPPELPPERELLADRMILTLGGSAAITAHNLSSLGSRVGFVTSRADDAFGATCAKALEGAGVDLSQSVVAPQGVGTGVTFILQHDGFRRAFTYPGTISALNRKQLNIEYLTSSKHFHLSSFFLQQDLREDVPELFSTLKRAGLTVSLDTNDDPSDQWPEVINEVLKHVDILMPNEREACRMAKEPKIEDAIRVLAERVPLLVIKRGARGAMARSGGDTHVVPAFPVTAVDAVGAGDTFNAGFLHAYVHGRPIDECLKFGNLAGAYSTQAAGGVAAFQDKTAMEQFFESRAEGLYSATR